MKTYTGEPVGLDGLRKDESSDLIMQRPLSRHEDKSYFLKKHSSDSMAEPRTKQQKVRRKGDVIASIIPHRE
jgi:hypothetical protein